MKQTGLQQELLENSEVLSVHIEFDNPKQIEFMLADAAEKAMKRMIGKGKG